MALQNPLHAHICRARLTVCEMGMYFREAHAGPVLGDYSKELIAPLPPFNEPDMLDISPVEIPWGSIRLIDLCL